MVVSPATILDEVGHWRSDQTANPDEEVYQAIKPAMATIPNALLIGISSPYARRGLLWRKYRDNWGKPGRTLVIKATTRELNPTVPEATVAEALAADPAWAGAEYLAEFRSDLEAFVTQDAVAAVLDVIREIKPPFSPEAVVAEFAALLKSYGLVEVAGDRYAGSWPEERFREHVELLKHLQAKLMPFALSFFLGHQMPLKLCPLCIKIFLLSIEPGLHRLGLRLLLTSTEHACAATDDRLSSGFCIDLDLFGPSRQLLGGKRFVLQRFG